MIKSVHGSPIESIYCTLKGDGAHLKVVDLDEMGRQEVIQHDKPVFISKDNTVAPNNCPLRIPTIQRNVGNYVACVTCLYSVVHDNADNFDY